MGTVSTTRLTLLLAACQRSEKMETNDFLGFREEVESTKQNEIS